MGAKRKNSSTPDELNIALETQLLRELASEWRQLNDRLFKARMQLPQIELSPFDSTLGQWTHEKRILSLSRKLILKKPWAVVIEVMKHEMAHQFVDEVLQIHDETAHGPTFRRVCDEIGLDAKAQGLPEPDLTLPGSSKNIVAQKIAKLLALAESSNVFEAENAMLTAQRLILKHEISVLQTAYTRTYSIRHLGQVVGRISEPMRVLAALLTTHFFVEGIWISVYRPLEGKRGSLFEICGREENLDMAEYAHGFLISRAQQLWQEHKKKLGIRSDVDKNMYITGVLQGFESKLSEQKSRHKQEYGLVHLVDKQLESYFRKRYPRIRSIRYQNIRTSAWAHGKAAGRAIILSKAITHSSLKNTKWLGP